MKDKRIFFLKKRDREKENLDHLFVNVNVSIPVEIELVRVCKNSPTRCHLLLFFLWLNPNTGSGTYTRAPSPSPALRERHSGWRVNLLLRLLHFVAYVSALLLLSERTLFSSFLILIFPPQTIYASFPCVTD